MASVEEHSGFGTRQRGREVADLSIERDLVQVNAFNHPKRADVQDVTKAEVDTLCWDTPHGAKVGSKEQ
jgi:hypothetical protein